jgi:hypothetical protein
MSEPLPVLMENAIQIAWDYLEAIGEIQDPDEASRLLLKSVEAQVYRGERGRLMLSNTAINDYKKFVAERPLRIVA